MYTNYSVLISPEGEEHQIDDRKEIVSDLLPLAAKAIKEQKNIVSPFFTEEVKIAGWRGYRWVHNLPSHLSFANLAALYKAAIAFDNARAEFCADAGVYVTIDPAFGELRLAAQNEHGEREAFLSLTKEELGV
jgi:hypothetical protein